MIIFLDFFFRTLGVIIGFSIGFFSLYFLFSQLFKLIDELISFYF